MLGTRAPLTMARATTPASNDEAVQTGRSDLREKPGRDELSWRKMADRDAPATISRVLTEALVEPQGGVTLTTTQGLDQR